MSPCGLFLARLPAKSNRSALKAANNASAVLRSPVGSSPVASVGGIPLRAETRAQPPAGPGVATPSAPAPAARPRPEPHRAAGCPARRRAPDWHLKRDLLGHQEVERRVLLLVERGSPPA